MSSQNPRLRGNTRRRSGPYPLGDIPQSVAVSIGKQIAHRLAIGHANIEGNDFGEIFATAISGRHRQKPLGIADVEWNGCAWTVKTVQAKEPYSIGEVRLISGRNDINYSCGINDPYCVSF